MLEALRAQDEQRIQSEIERARGRDAEDAKLVAPLRAALKEKGIYYISDQEVISAVVAVCKSGVASIYAGMASAADTLEKAARQIRESHTALGLPELERVALRRKGRGV
jgi:hypothetical protein